MIVFADLVIFGFGLILLLETFLCFFTLAIRTYHNKHYDKTVTIIRGVPGSGKRYLITDLEKDSLDQFAICDRNQYFIKNSIFKFKGSDISKSKFASRMKFLYSLVRKVKNIYVIGYFNEKWMYLEYIQLAKMNNYKVRIIELKCKDRDTLNYFNNRSVYKTPNLKSRNCYSNWEEDTHALMYEPYIESLPGDTLPHEQYINLDKQLEDYWNGECKIVDERDDRNVKKIQHYDGFVNFVSNPTFRNILKREYTNKNAHI